MQKIKNKPKKVTRNQNYHEVRICVKCGRELPLKDFWRSRSDDIKYVKNWCRECHSQYNKNRRAYKNVKIYMEDKTVKTCVRYKPVLQQKVLDLTETHIRPIANDEIFVKLMDYRDCYVSNYGRVVEKKGGKYVLKRMTCNFAGDLIYSLYKNIRNNKEKYIYKKVEVRAEQLVVQEFVVNADMENNVRVWHKRDDRRNCYYKNLYPMNMKQYQAVEDIFMLTGEDSEETIENILYDAAYKPDGWKPSVEKRSTCGKGYVGCAKAVEGDREAYVKWANMMQRCYNTKSYQGKAFYEGVTVCEEWMNFSNFKLWYRQNKHDDRKYDLDKDILFQGNTVYSPDTCCLVTHYINTMFEKRNDEMSTTITLNEEINMYEATYCLLGSKKTVGVYTTEEEAKQGIREYKKQHILEIAEKLKGNVPDKLYNAMKAWQVE